MSGLTNQRKLDHVRIASSEESVDRRKYYFDTIRLRHRALPETDLEEIDTSVEFLGKKLSFPLLISCMTGGDADQIEAVNRHLAKAAETTGVAMGVGSQRVMFTTPAARRSFSLRQYAPKALLFSNLGAVQLNRGFDADMCREAVEVLAADGLYLHLNPVQEVVQAEGDTCFKGLAARIGEVARALDTPVLVKEVGAGIGRVDAELLIEQGIRFIDVAGAGGTSWSRIEHYRRAGDEESDLGLLFQDWGLPTPMALDELRPLRGRVTLVASGGIRSGVDMAKAMVLGASLCGIARPFLTPALQSAEEVVARIERLKREFAAAMFLLGARTVHDLIGNEDLILSRTFPAGAPDSEGRL